MKSFEGKRVMVSGGAGVIGRELVDILYKEGAKVWVGDLKPRPDAWAKDILYRRGDLNYLTAEEVLSFSPEYFFHLAATFERTEETSEFWAENDHHNVRLSHHLVNCVKNATALKRIIFASSYLIYDEKQYLFPEPASVPTILDEASSLLYPRNLCGAAKRYHEHELEFLEHFNGDRFSSVWARIYRVYGRGSRDVISRWIRSLLKDQPLKVFREEGMFDYVYAKDVARGLFLLAQNEVCGPINLATGRARKVKEVLEVLRKYFPRAKIENENGPDGLYEASQANIDYLKKTVGWCPTYTLETAIPEIIEYEKAKGGEDSLKAFGNVLVTSLGGKVPLIKTLRQAIKKVGTDIKIFGADSNENCIGRDFIDNFWLLPKLENIKSFIEECQRRNISSIIPTRDGELSFFAKHKEALAAKGIKVMVSDLPTVELCLDKYRFFEFCKTQELKTIPTWTDVQKVPFETSEKWVVKECVGAGSRKLGLDMLPNEVKEFSKHLDRPIFQPHIKGKEYSVDLYIDRHGVLKGNVVRERVHIVDGESQVTRVVKNEVLEEISQIFAKSFKFYGHVLFQCIEEAQTKNYYLLECNPRFGGASTLSVAYGLDSFYWFLLESNGEDIEHYRFSPTNITQMVRHKADFYR